MATATRSAAVRIVRLDQLILDHRASPRTEVDPARVDEFAGLYRDELTAGNDPFPPIRCVEDRDGRLLLYDGWHRVTARGRVATEHPGRGYDELPAEVIRSDARDAVDHAYELAIACSALGSKQLTLSERKGAAKRLREIRPDLPVRGIARQLGISHATVLRALGSLPMTGGGSREPSPAAASSGEKPQTRRSSQRVTLEQLAYRTAGALCQLLDQSRDESRGMLGLGKPNVMRAGELTYKALEHSYGEDAPAVTDDLLALVNAMWDRAARGS
jgi:hypothetical protein